MPTDEAEVAAPVPTETCCQNQDTKTAKKCQICQQVTVCRNCRSMIRGRAACEACKQKVLAELEKQQADGNAAAKGFVAGVLAAMGAGAIWAAIAVMGNMEIGWLAIGVGWLAAQAVMIGSGNKRGRKLQWAAVVCAGLGLLLGKYFAYAHYMIEFSKQNGGPNPVTSYFSPISIITFPFVLPQMLSPFDALWLFLAFGVAWRTPKQEEVAIR